MAVIGSALLDFGAAPGSESASVAITGQAEILSTSVVEAWVDVPAAGTADHTPDEHWVEELRVRAGNIVPGVGFTIYGIIGLGKAIGTFRVNWVWTHPT
jgi:hypothetical protein